MRPKRARRRDALHLRDDDAAVVLDGDGLLEPLVETMREARDRDAAILWLVDQPWLLRDEALPATRRLRLRGRELVDAAAAA